MADLAQGAVTSLNSWYDGSLPTNRQRCKEVSLVLTGQGTTTNKVLASVLGFTHIEEATSFVASDDSVILVATPSYDGTMLLFKAAGTNAPADFSGTFTGIIRGQ